VNGLPLEHGRRRRGLRLEPCRRSADAWAPALPPCGPVTWGQAIDIHRLSRPTSRISDSGLPIRDNNHDRTNTDLPNLPHRDQADRVARGTAH
jgi:hypothetical protein